MISRRTFLRSAILGGSAIGIGLATYDLSSEGPTGDFITEHVNVHLPHLPPAFDGYRVGFLTDLHIGIWVPEEWIHRALSQFVRNEVDILVLGGDFILVNDNSLWQECGIVRNEKFAGLSKREATPRIYRAFGECFQGQQFPDGIIAVVGNHDHWNQFPVFLEILKDFPAIRVLLNEEWVVSRAEQKLSFFGVDDYLTGLPAAPPPAQRADRNAARIIVSHNPDYISALLEEDRHEFSLALCGHTHGGQIVLPGIGPVAAQVVDRRFVAGMHDVGDKLVYTSRGLGVVGLPFRVNCPAEITIFTLRRAEQVSL